MESQKRKIMKGCAALVTMLLLCLILTIRVSAVSVQEPTTTGPASTGNISSPRFGFSIETSGGEEDLAGSVEIILILTVIALAPSILIMLTSFTRILIVLHFTRAALNTQSAPPNQVLIGLALFLTFFVMAPVFSEVNTQAIEPLREGTITQEEAFEAGIRPLKKFMLDQLNEKDLNMMLELGEMGAEDDPMNYSLVVVVPSFILGELRQAFIIGFLIYIPFIVIDMVVSSVLMSMGMMMLPPTTISMPFKILLFVLADGWNLIIVNLIKTFVR